MSNDGLDMSVGISKPVPVLSVASGSMQRIQPATLEEIALRAGVSAGTVSRVLNGKNKENRPAIARRSDRIRKIAGQLGYRPNLAARSMLRGTFQTVAFVTCGDLGNDWYPISALNSIHATLDASQWRLMFYELPASKIADPELVPALFREASVDGLIVNLIPTFSEDVVEYFESQPLPCVWMNLKRPHGCVHPDDVGGAELAVKHLINRGHTRIGYFCRLFSSPAHFSVMDRFNGYTAAMKAANLPPHRHLELLGAPMKFEHNSMERAEAFLRQFPDVQAVICYECEEAICMHVAAERIGRKVPESLEIVGIHEREIRANSGLRIPTAVIPFQEIGSQAVKMLREMIDRQTLDIPSVTVPFRSIIS